MKPGGWGSIKAIMTHPKSEWGDANIKSIRYAYIEDFFAKLKFSSKTKHNILTTLKQFWGWAAKRYEITLIEDWPEIGKVKMARRKTLDPHTRALILAGIKVHEPFRVGYASTGFVSRAKYAPARCFPLTRVTSTAIPAL